MGVAMRIMIICPHFRGIEYGVVESFRRLGYEVYPLYFSVGIDDWHYIQRLKLKLNISIEGFLSKEMKKFNMRVIGEFNKINPEYVYVIQGRWMNEETIDFIRERSYITLYLWDMVSLFPEMIPTFSHYNKVYSFDKNDTEFLRKNDVNAEYKASGYDPSVYHKMESRKKYDISFIGAMYPERVEMLKCLIKKFPDLHWAIYGEYAPLRNPGKWLKWRFSTDRNYFRNKNINKNEVNIVYNESKIVISIVRSNQKDGWSARLPEILGAGAFQITNWYDSVEREFSGCLCTYKTIDELITKITYFIEHDVEREKIAERGYQKVLKEFSDDVLNQRVIENFLNTKNMNKKTE